MQHAFYLVCCLVIAVSLDGHLPPHKESVLLGLLMATIIVAFFIAFPQVMFKPEERTLTLSEDGITTRIGKKSGTAKWEEIIEIQDLPQTTVILRKNGNALLIPRRAFNSESERSDCLTAMRTWQAHQAG
jgi:hypothetical protein